MRIRPVWLYVLPLFLIAPAVGCSKSEAPGTAATAAAPATDTPAASASRNSEAVAKGEALFQQKCSQCHDLKRATSRTETKEKWAEIVKQMQKKPGSGISDADASKILDYLVTQHKTAPQF